MKIKNILITALCLLIIGAMLLTGCGTDKSEPALETVAEIATFDNEISGVKISVDEGGAIGEQPTTIPPETETEMQTTAEPVSEEETETEEETTTVDEPSALELLFQNHEDFAKDMLTASGGADIYVFDSTIEFDYDMTDYAKSVIERNPEANLEDFMVLFNYMLQENKNYMILMQRYFTQLLGEEITIQVTFMIDNIVIVADYYNNSSDYDTNVPPRELEEANQE